MKRAAVVGLLLLIQASVGRAQSYRSWEPVVVTPPPPAELSPRSWNASRHVAYNASLDRSAERRYLAQAAYNEPANVAPRLEPYEGCATHLVPANPVVPATPAVSSSYADPRLLGQPELIPVHSRSSYSGASPWQRGGVYVPSTYPVNSYSGYPQTVYRPIQSISMNPPTNAYGSSPAGYVVGKGLIGQPKLFIPGQPLRNFLRYVSP